jgi:hypothetical protein
MHTGTAGRWRTCAEMAPAGTFTISLRVMRLLAVSYAVLHPFFCSSILSVGKRGKPSTLQKLIYSRGELLRHDLFIDHNKDISLITKVVTLY